MALEITTDLAMLERLLGPKDKDVVDVGCGAGTLVRALGARGARPIGIEISEPQLERARAADAGTGARYLVGCAQALPLGDESADAVVFMRSLHHVPVAEMPAALSEARRVLRPGGVLYVAEPLPSGDYYQLVCLVEDEREVREAAQRTLDDGPSFGLLRDATVDYGVRVSLGGLDALRDRFVSVDPARASVFDARAETVAEAFARLGEPGEGAGERCFIQPMRAAVLTQARPPQR